MSKPRDKFSTHKSSAHKRGIEFLLTFEEWWSLWEPYWSRRGRKRGQYVMARFGDKGPYSIDNARIITQEQNSRERKLSDPRYADAQARIREARKIQPRIFGRKPTDAAREKMRLAKLGSVRPEKTRKKQGESLKAFWANPVNRARMLEARN